MTQEQPVGPAAGQPVFYYELSSPACYLAAEQIVSGLPVVPEWEPVPPGSNPGDPDPRRIEELAARLGLQPIRWPPNRPPDIRFAMLAATYAKRVGRAVAFSLAAFRQAFAGGADLGDRDTVLIAAAACEMHPTAVLKGVALRSVAEALDRAAERAAAAGVTTLPAIEAAGRVFEGPESIARAAAWLEGPGGLEGPARPKGER